MYSYMPSWWKTETLVRSSLRTSEPLPASGRSVERRKHQPKGRHTPSERRSKSLSRTGLTSNFCLAAFLGATCHCTAMLAVCLYIFYLWFTLWTQCTEAYKLQLKNIRSAEKSYNVNNTYVKHGFHVMPRQLQFFCRSKKNCDDCHMRCICRLKWDMWLCRWRHWKCRSGICSTKWFWKAVNSI